jgi:hypothetical protein
VLIHRRYKKHGTLLSRIAHEGGGEGRGHFLCVRRDRGPEGQKQGGALSTHPPARCMRKRYKNHETLLTRALAHVHTYKYTRSRTMSAAICRYTLYVADVE